MQAVENRLLIPLLALTWAIALATGLFLFELPLDWLLAAAVGIGALMAIGTLPTPWVVLALIGTAMFINVANYSFLTFNAEGELSRGSESAAIAVLRLPLALLVVAVIFRRYGTGFGAYLRKNWDVVLFAVIPFFSAVFAFDVPHAAQYALWMFITLISILGLIFVLQKEIPWWQWAEHLGWLLFLSSGVMVVFALFGLPEALSGANTGAVQASYGSAYIYSLFCSVVLASILVIERQKSYGFASRLLRRIPVPAILLFSLLTVVPLVFSGKRSAIVTAGLVLVVYALSGSLPGAPRRATGTVRAFIVAGVVAMAVYVFLPRAEFTLFRFGKMFDSEENTSLQHRFDTIDKGIDLFKEYPVFGVGIDNGGPAVGYGLHNTYLGILLETGIVGALLFVVILLRSLGWWLRLHQSTKIACVLLAIPAVLISATEYTGAPGQAMFWPLWIAILAPRLALGRREAIAPPTRRGGDAVEFDPEPS